MLAMSKMLAFLLNSRSPRSQFSPPMADIDSQRYEKHDMLLDACANNDAEEVQRRIDKCDPSTFNNEALVTACTFGSLGVVQTLLQDERVTPTSEAFTAACAEGHSNVINVLLSDARCNLEKCVRAARTLQSVSGNIEQILLHLGESETMDVEDAY